MYVPPLPVQVAMALMRLNALPSQTAQISGFLVLSHMHMSNSQLKIVLHGKDKK